MLQVPTQVGDAEQAARVVEAFSESEVGNTRYLLDRLAATLRNPFSLNDAEQAAKVVEAVASGEASETRDMLEDIAVAIRDRAWDD